MSSRSLVVGTLLACLLAACLLAACACSSPAPGASPEAGAAGSGAAVGGAGQTAGAGGAGTVAIGGPCTPDKTPNDEFYIPCPDAGSTPIDAALPAVDSGQPPVLDAGAMLDATAAPADEGQCAERNTDCSYGHGATTVGSASCSIAGDSLRVEREVCEVCSKPTTYGDHMLSIRDCGGCIQVYGEGLTVARMLAVAANACYTRADSIGLTWTAADPHCVDVYAYVGSGVANGLSWSLQSSDLVRLCRCDRTTDTCVSCANGACGATP